MQERRARLAWLGLAVTLAALVLPAPLVLLVLLGLPEQPVLLGQLVLVALAVLLALRVIPDPKG